MLNEARWLFLSLSHFWQLLKPVVFFEAAWAVAIVTPSCKPNQVKLVQILDTYCCKLDYTLTGWCNLLMYLETKHFHAEESGSISTAFKLLLFHYCYLTEYISYKMGQRQKEAHNRFTHTNISYDKVITFIYSSQHKKLKNLNCECIFKQSVATLLYSSNFFQKNSVLKKFWLCVRGGGT